MAYCTLSFHRDFRDADIETHEFKTEELAEEHQKKAENILPTRRQARRENKEIDDLEEFLVADEIDMKLHGEVSHTQLMLALQYHLYDELRPTVVERRNYDLVDRENRIMGEVGCVNGKKSVFKGRSEFVRRVFRFLLGHGDIENRENWRFYWLPYESDFIYECRLTNESLRKIKDNLETDR